MDPLLWGPCIWKTLFSISFNTCASDLPQIEKLLKILEKVIPCPTCRTHYRVNREEADKLFPIKKSKNNMSYWLWHMKSLVNKKLKVPNTEFKYIKMRYELFGHNICDTELIDVLIMMSLFMVKDDEQKRFHEFLFTLGNLLTRFMSGQLPSLLQCIDNVSPALLLDVGNSVRSNYGLSQRDLNHYIKFSE